jgi:hypothetical protein
MMTFQATAVHTLLDADYGEGSVVFRWPDKQYEFEELRIDCDGHCSRGMPWYSGAGLQDATLKRNSIRLRFAPELATSLRLADQIEIGFELCDKEFTALQGFINLLMGNDEC